MEFTSTICRVFHEEHMAVLNNLERLENILAEFEGDSIPAADDRSVRFVLDQTLAMIEGEIGYHFQFEEDHLFPIFSEIAEPEIAEMLRAEHADILPVAKELAALIQETRTQGYTPRNWRVLKRLGGVVAADLGGHARKEEEVLLPPLEAELSPDADADLYRIYAEAKSDGG